MPQYLLIDDRRSPEMFGATAVARTSNEAISLLNRGGWDRVYFDNDLGTGQKEGWQIVVHMMYRVNPEKWPDEMAVVSDNPPARQNIESKFGSMGYERLGKEDYGQVIWERPNALKEDDSKLRLGSVKSFNPHIDKPEYNTSVKRNYGQIEKELEKAYARNMPQSVIDRLETELAQHVTEEDIYMTEDDPTVSEGVHGIAGPGAVEEELAYLYKQYLSAPTKHEVNINPRGTRYSKEDLAEMMYRTLQESKMGHTMNPNVPMSQVLDAAKDAFENRSRYIQQYRSKTPHRLVQALADTYPLAGASVDGLTVLKDIPSTSSISSSFNTGEYTVLKGIRAVPMVDFQTEPKKLFYAADDLQRTNRLAEEIRYSQEIKPLIIVSGEKEGPYILEGAHRLGALHILGKKHFPALVVDVSEDEPSTLKVACRYLKQAVESDNLMRWFGRSKVVDQQGKPLRVYHGSSRPDRLGTRVTKSRATSGPMIYFTDNPEIASSYAKNKRDTSLETPASYSEWFLYKPKGMRRSIPITRAWYFLSNEEREKLTRNLPHVVNQDKDGNTTESFRLGGPDEYGMADKEHWDYTIREKRGNMLEAALDIWVDSGGLYDSEEEFMEVLRLAGFDMSKASFNDPWVEYPGVMAVYLKIENPLDTANIPPNVVDALEKAVSRTRGVKKQHGADFWDKSIRDAREWLDELKEGIQKGTTLAWTSIPDWATKTLKSLGYDGVKDKGGKHGGDIHTVWVPFDEHQVKSAIGNIGTYDPTKKDIHREAADGTPQDKGPLKYLGEDYRHKRYYLMDVRKDTYIHFTTSKRASKIVQSGKLLLDAPHQGAGVYGVFAISTIFGKYYPSVSLDRVEKRSEEEGGTAVAIEFKTNTVPLKYGHADEVAWGEQDVKLINPKVISKEEAIAKINASPYKLDDEYDEFVIYDKSMLSDVPGFKPAVSVDVGVTPARVVLAFLKTTGYNDLGEAAWKTYNERYSQAIDEAIDNIAANKLPRKLMPLNTSRMKKIWRDYARTGVVRDERGVDDILDDFLEKTVRIDVNNYLSGHTSGDPLLEFKDREIPIPKDIDDRIDVAIADINGHWMISDYGINKLASLIHQAMMATDYEAKLLALDAMLNIVHQRSNLAAWFVQGGKGALDAISQDTDAEPSRTLTSKTAGAGLYYWHGSPSGELRGSRSGIHIGSRLAAKQALEARIGSRADGKDWDGTQSYGDTLLAGKDTLKKIGVHETGFNTHGITEDFYLKDHPEVKAKYSSGDLVPLQSKPNLFQVKLIGPMSNTVHTPYDDFKANGYMAASIKRGNAKKGFFYKNVSEDEGSISAVVPNAAHLEIVGGVPSVSKVAGLYLWSVKTFSPKQASRVVQAYLYKSMPSSLSWAELGDVPLYKDPTPSDIEEIMKEDPNTTVRAAVDGKGDYYAWNGKVMHYNVGQFLHTQWSGFIEYDPHLSVASLYVRSDKKEDAERFLPGIEKVFPRVTKVETAFGDYTFDKSTRRHVVEPIMNGDTRPGRDFGMPPESLVRQYHRMASKPSLKYAKFLKNIEIYSPEFPNKMGNISMYQDPNEADIDEILASTPHKTIRLGITNDHVLYAWDARAYHAQAEDKLDVDFVSKLEYDHNRGILSLSVIDGGGFLKTHTAPMYDKLHAIFPRVKSLTTAFGSELHKFEPTATAVQPIRTTSPIQQYRWNKEQDYDRSAARRVVGSFLSKSADVPGYYRVEGDKVYIKHDLVPDSVWNKFSKAMNTFDYDFRGGEDAKELLKRWNKTPDGDTILSEDHAKAFLSAVGKKDIHKPSRGVSSQKVIRDAMKRFGITNNIYHAGYMLPDGRLLNLSGGGSYGSPRGLDHREIESVLPKGMVPEGSSGFASIEAFGKLGNIRLHMGTDKVLNVYLYSRPTSAQIDAMEDLMRKERVGVIIGYGRTDKQFGPEDVDDARAFIRDVTTC